MRANFVMSGVAAGMRRNLLMTVALVLTTAIGFLFVGSALLANSEISKFKHTYESKLNVSIYLCATQFQRPCTAAASPQDLATLRNDLTNDPHIRSFDFISEDQALQLAKQAQPAVAAFIKPGVLPASFTVKLRALQKDYTSFQAKYSKYPGVFEVNNQIDTINTLLNIIDSVRWGAVIVAMVVLVASMFLIVIFVQVAAAQRKNETSIMRLVGASRWMTELPFILETMIATIAGAVLSFAGMWIGKDYLLDGVLANSTKHGVIPNLDINDVLKAGGVSLLVGVVLATAAAFATLRLRVRL